MTTATVTAEKTFKRFDMQDESDFAIETLAGMKEWLTDFWRWSNDEDEDMSEEELKAFFVEIENADEDGLYEMLAGIDYTFSELDEEGNEIIYEARKLETSMSWGYGMVSEIISDKLVIQWLYKKKIIHEETMDLNEEIAIADQICEEHEKNCNRLWEKHLKNLNRCTFCSNKDNTDTKVVGEYTILESCEDCEEGIRIKEIHG